MSLVVSIVDPNGSVARVVTCRTGEQCQIVIDKEAKSRPPFTIFSVTGERRGRRVAVDRWGIDKSGRLRHAPYRKNAELSYTFEDDDPGEYSDDDLFGEDWV